MALVLITHDLVWSPKIADRVVVMNKGEIVETGTAGDIYHMPCTPIRAS